MAIAAGPYSAHISAERAIGLLTAQRPKLTVELRIANWTRVVADLLEGETCRFEYCGRYVDEAVELRADFTLSLESDRQNAAIE
jgi:hypothetical protein